jgi:hypothetical protein
MSPFAHGIAAVIVVTAGIYLIALAAVALARPALARRFLLGFAQTAAVHYTEMAARILVGLALLVASPRMLFPSFFYWFGVALLSSSVLLLCMPWKWHLSMSERVLPRFTRFLGVVGSVSLLLGGLLVAATVAAPSNISLERTHER